MAASKPVIALSWEPKVPPLSSSLSKINSSNKVQAEASSSLWRKNTELIDGLFVPPNDPRKLNKLLRKQVKDTTGKNWFDMPAPDMTPELKKDLQLLKLRSVVDPKRHYKKGDLKSKSLPKYFQVGTVVEPAAEYFSGRLTRKDRKSTLADELLTDPSVGQYRKRKVREIEERNRPGGVDKWKIRGRQTRRHTKRRQH